MHAIRHFSFGSFLVLWVLILCVSAALNQRRRRERSLRVERGRVAGWSPVEETTRGSTAAGSLWPRAATCIAIGAGAPVGIFGFLWLMIATARPGEANEELILSGALLSAFAIGCGTCLAFLLLGSGNRTEQADPTAKPPAYDPESFDVASPHV